ncbi:MAG: HAMP domain-containing protein [Treponema sp.]|jgi:adenylate cyclase|nr:HAMP domain-containing protein [Treponema sp.]
MQRQMKIRFPIGLKLSLIISSVLFFSLSVITVLVSLLVGSDVRLTAENYNWTVNRWSANGAETVLSGLRDKALFLIRNIDAAGWSAEGAASEAAEDLIDRFYRLNPDISCAAFAGQGQGGIFMNNRFGAEDTAFNPSRLSAWLASRQDELQRAARGETLLFNGCPAFGSPLLIMLFPLPPEEGFSFSGAGTVFFSAAALESSVLIPPESPAGNMTGQHAVSFIVNGRGEALIHGDEELVRSGGRLDLPVVRQALEGDAANLQALYTGDDGLQYFGAFQRLSGLDAVVITGIESALVFRGVAAAVRGIVLTGFAVLALSVFCMILYSRTISRPVKVLAAAAAAVEEGNYRLSLEVKSRDEIGVLTESFIAMGHGLTNFERFTNREIVALARKGMLGRTGEKRTVTVCFAMIRGFTGITEEMSPRALVGFVNRFLLRMVPCVTRTGGLVDKFLTHSGLVIMAVWGLFPREGDGRGEGEDGVRAGAARYAFDGVRSALLMRNILRNLNRKRLVRGRPLVKMGCGINSGEVIAGQMGSEERMEYTVIGDVVNVASRIEEPNDVFDTDILITEDTWKLTGERLVAEEMPGLEIKGKSGILRVFSVVNIKNRYGPLTMEEVRRAWRM